MAGEVWRAWLAAAVLWASLPAGATVIAMMTRLIPGTWRDSLAPPLGLTPRFALVAAIAMAPVLFAPGLFYTWVAHPSGGGFREAWLSPLFFAVRGVLWLGVLGFLSRRMADGRAPKALSAIGLLILVPGSTVMADDWLMSLDPTFASSGFGLYVLSIEITAALALAIIVAVRRPLSGRALDALGGVLFVCLVMWAYLGFMQYFIIWSGDLPAGAEWFLRRDGGWAVLAWLAIALKLGPGILLIFSHVRRNARVSGVLASLMALGAVAEVGWLVLPAPGVDGGPLEIGLFIGFVAVFAVVTTALIARRRAPAEALP